MRATFSFEKHKNAHLFNKKYLLNTAFSNDLLFSFSQTQNTCISTLKSHHCLFQQHLRFSFQFSSFSYFVVATVPCILAITCQVTEVLITSSHFWCKIILSAHCHQISQHFCQQFFHKSKLSYSSSNLSKSLSVKTVFSSFFGSSAFLLLKFCIWYCNTWKKVNCIVSSYLLQIFTDIKTQHKIFLIALALVNFQLNSCLLFFYLPLLQISLFKLKVLHSWSVIVKFKHCFTTWILHFLQ